MNFHLAPRSCVHRPGRIDAKRSSAFVSKTHAKPNHRFYKGDCRSPRVGSLGKSYRQASTAGRPGCHQRVRDATACGRELYRTLSALFRVPSALLFRDALARNCLIRVGVPDRTLILVPGIISKRGSKSTMVDANFCSTLASPCTLAVPSAICASRVFAPIIVLSRSERLIVSVSVGSLAWKPGMVTGAKPVAV